MRKILIIFMLLILLLAVGCSTNDTETTATTNTKTEQAISEPEMQTGLLTKTFTFKDENSSWVITINNIDHIGTVDRKQYITDKDEPDYQVTGFLSEMFCSTFWNLYRDYDAANKEYEKSLEEMKDYLEEMNITVTDEDNKEEVDMDKYLTGFKATKFSIEFIDKEDGTTISECYNTGTGENDLTYKGYDTTTKRENELWEEQFSFYNESYDYNGATVTEESSSNEKDVECPKMTKGSSFSFDYNKDYDILQLNADFLIGARFSDGWELNYEPYEDYFSCEKGSVAGENINNLYCTPSSSYYSTLKKNTIDDDGNIVQTDYLSIKSLIFDAKGKDTTRVDDLKSLQFENMTCSESYY